MLTKRINGLRVSPRDDGKTITAVCSLSARAGLRRGLRQVPEERAGAQVQPAGPGEAVHLAALLGEDLRGAQAPPGVQPPAVQGAAEVRGGSGHLLHGFRDGRGEDDVAHAR